MLFIKYRKGNSCHAIRVVVKIIIFMRSLQARVKVWLQKRKGALRFASCEGSVTVETVLVLPIFLWAAAGLLMLGNLLMTEAKIQYALSKTADVYAARKAMESFRKDSSDGRKTESGQAGGKVAGTGDVSRKVKDMARSMLTTAGLQAIFSSVYEESPVDSSCLSGGRAGIVLSASLSGDEKEMVEINAVYCLKIDIPFVGTYSFPKKAAVTQRIFSGYTEGKGSGDGSGKEGSGVVYVTEHGSVYHTSLSCSHICLRISGGNVERILKEKKYHACDKCIDDEEAPPVLYVTRYGDKYHSSLSCSGLKRTVRTIPKEEAEGMKMCSRCAAKQ